MRTATELEVRAEVPTGLATKARASKPRLPGGVLSILTLLAILLAGCGGSTKTTAPPPSTADFSLSMTPPTQTLAAGSSIQASLLATATGGFSAPVTIAVSGLANGVSFTPATITLTPGTASTITFTAAAGATPGAETLTFTGTSGTLVHTAALALTLAPAADFTLAVSPASQTLTAGGAGMQVTLTATATGGFSAPVNVTLSGLGNGVSSTPASLTLTPGTPAIITLAASANATPGAETLTFTGTSGTRSHTAALALTVAPAVAAPADFTLAVTPAAQTLTAGASAQVSLLATGTAGFNLPVTIAVAGLGAGVTVSPASIALTPGTAATITLTATAQASAGAETITFTGTSGSLAHAANLALTVTTALKPAGLDITTYHYDNTRQGWNPQETQLTLTNVTPATFGLKGLYPLDGKVDAAPLYLGNVALPAGPGNVLYLATEHGSLFALDPATGKQLWKTSTLGAGETPSDDHSCNQISPEIGITATPVIDRTFGSHGAIFLVAMSKDTAGAYHQRLHALDLVSGAELPGSPTEIAGTYPGVGQNSINGNVVFDPGKYAERPALLMLNGTIYLAWTSHCDQPPYTGWVMAYSESTLKQTSVLNLTPNGSDGAIWMAGYGMTADGAGNIFFLDANGTLDLGFDANGFPSSGDYGNSILKLSTTNGLKVADFWEPFNSYQQSAADIDLGSGGAMLLPDVPDSTGTLRHLLVGAGKDRNLYIADRDNLGKLDAGSNGTLYQQITNAFPDGAWSGPAFFNNTVFYGAQNDVLRAFPITNARLAATPSSTSAKVFPYPGTTPSVSSNGNAQGILWAVESGTGKTAVLHAYDATNLAHELYNSTQAPNTRDAFGTGNKFITPVVSNGMVFIGTPTGIAIFGLLP